MPSALVPRGWQEAGGHPCAEAVYPTPPPLGVLMISQAPAEADPPKTGAAYLRLAPGDGCGHVTTVEGGGCWSGRLGATLGGERARVEVPRRRAGGGVFRRGQQQGPIPRLRASPAQLTRLRGGGFPLLLCPLRPSPSALPWGGRQRENWGDRLGLAALLGCSLIVDSTKSSA